MLRLRTTGAFAVLLALLLGVLCPLGAVPDKERKVSTLKGVVYRGERSRPVANAQILMLTFQGRDQLEEKYDTKTDATGAYRLEGLPGGKYRITIRVLYDTREQVPCKLSAAKTSDKNSVVAVLEEEGKFVEQVFIDGFSIKAGKELEKDFDLQCQPMFSTAASGGTQ